MVHIPPTVVAGPASRLDFRPVPLLSARPLSVPDYGVTVPPEACPTGIRRPSAADLTQQSQARVWSWESCPMTSPPCPVTLATGSKHLALTGYAHTSFSPPYSDI